MIIQLASAVRPIKLDGSSHSINVPIQIEMYKTITPTTVRRSRLKFLRNNCPITSATTIAIHAGKTEPGVATKPCAIITPKTAFTISNNRNMTMRNNDRVRLPITLSDRAPIDLPLLRLLAHKAPISWIPAKKIVPKTTHKSAGANPQYTAIAGPTIGAAPATEVK